MTAQMNPHTFKFLQLMSNLGHLNGFELTSKTNGMNEEAHI